MINGSPWVMWIIDYVIYVYIYIFKKSIFNNAGQLYKASVLTIGIRGWVPPRQQADLTHNRTVNVTGGAGKSLPMDLVNEHCNRDFKGNSKMIIIIEYTLTGGGEQCNTNSMISSRFRLMEATLLWKVVVSAMIPDSRLSKLFKNGKINNRHCIIGTKYNNRFVLVDTSKNTTAELRKTITTADGFNISLVYQLSHPCCSVVLHAFSSLGWQGWTYHVSIFMATTCVETMKWMSHDSIENIGMNNEEMDYEYIKKK